MESNTNIPCSSSTEDGTIVIDRNQPSTSFAQNEKKEDDDDDDECAEFYFESEHLALRGNKDYLNVLKTISVLEAQRIKAIEDYDKLLSLQEEALRDPMKFVQKLQRGENIGIPSPQIIAELPNIDWSAYSMPVPSELSRPQTRKTVNKPSDHPEHDVKDLNDLKSKVLVRGRLFDDSKPETFNQLWTAEEQRRLEELLIEYPPEEVETRRWRKIAAALGNRTTKQVCSRVQKYFIKLHKAGLPIPGRPPKMPEVSRRGHYYRSHFNHRYQKYNHLFRQTTFFPQQDIPVYMSDFDDDTYGTCPPPNSDIDIKVEDDKEDRMSDDEDKNRNSVEYRQLDLIRRVKRDKETEFGRKPVYHYGYKCDLCKQEPMVGTRWHCVDCMNMSVDFCSDCVVTQMESSNPHPPTHRLVEVRKSEQKGGVWDQDYGMDSFSLQPDRYNYLDPNFMPE
ncbi:hypothetical protein L9F63_016083 [Diploptera punctata]|uniref:ZZ-type zinc finger-containing protein 3 n=1 Tax=Diploptera punctata TaxID=6984 RepID=A0AAD8EHV4_DIPPU|nr:hypothetical protein L9F63_016083 [Diploptera punctata]